MNENMNQTMNEKLFSAMTELDQAIIEQAYPRRRPGFACLWTACAACACMLAAAGVLALALVPHPLGQTEPAPSEQVPSEQGLSEPSPLENGVPYPEPLFEYPERSLEQLIADSDLIVRAKMIGTKETKERNHLVVTDCLFEVLEVYSGEKAVGDTVTVEMPGGVKDTPSDEDTIGAGQQVILILSYPTDENGAVSSTEYYVYYPPAGLYRQSEDDPDRFVARDPGFSFHASTAREEIDAVRQAAQ